MDGQVQGEGYGVEAKLKQLDGGWEAADAAKRYRAGSGVKERERTEVLGIERIGRELERHAQKQIADAVA